MDGDPTRSTGGGDTPPEARAPVRPRQHFILAAALLAAFAILAAGALVALELRGSQRGAGATVLGSVIGGPFKLTDQNGETVTNTDLEGKWLLVYFGYTHCPDACPTALSNIALALADLGPKKSEVRPVFITVDPARDTAAALKDYVSAFDAPILALTGSDSEIAHAAREYRVYYAKHPEPGGDYSMDHSSVIYVMDPKGRFSASLTGEDPPAAIAARLKKLLG